ncbi:hypothetical protein V5740_06150 [Croceibacterium sp. TMG7-5b_MA50]|uniref:hypothetical protein n=1 Tax=Croceibacterium sp. TMG7-5b_MA50 TaxID=3121290 RepID=UPI00322193F5
MSRLIAIALSGFAFAVTSSSAAAQIASPPPPPAVDLPVDVQVTEIPAGAELEALRDSIRDGRASGQLTRRQGRRLRKEVHVLESTADRYAQDGTSAHEEREMQVRAIVARQQADAMRGVTVGSPSPPR